MASVYADPGKIERDFGWKPNYPLIEQIVASAWNWHQNHPNGYMAENLSQISPQ